jgi:hypothetical protein
MEERLITIHKETKMNEIEQSILSDINSYLDKNKDSVADFNLIKDIVDRKLDQLDDEINSSIPVPLYLGLAGTMLGIIIGLGFMPSLSSKEFEQSIDVLLAGVKLAMIASFCGLLLTVISSGYSYKRAKRIIEQKRNDFFSFIQTELLPVITQNLSASLISLQNNLITFNNTFGDNINKFNSVLGDIKGSFDSQVELMKEIQDLDVVKLSRVNIDVLRELKSSVSKFEIFNQYLTQINAFVANAKELNVSIERQIHRTNDIHSVASDLRSNISNNQDIMNFLRDELKEIQSRRQFVKDAVIHVDQSVSEALDGLEQTFIEKKAAIQKITIREEELLTELLQEKRGNLDELQKLSDVSKTLAKIEGILTSQNQNILKQNNLLNVKEAKYTLDLKNMKLPKKVIVALVITALIFLVPILLILVLLYTSFF